MTLSPLAALAGAGLGTLAEKVTQSVSETLSFAQVFQRALQQSTACAESQASQAADAHAADSSHDADELSSSTDELRENAQRLLEQFQQQLKIRLAMRGIDPAQPLELEIDELGQIRAGSANPNRAAIEQLFVDDASLTDMLHEIARQFAAVRAADHAASASDPSHSNDAESYVGDAFSGRQSDDANSGPKNFRLLLVGDQVQVELT